MESMLRSEHNLEELRGQLPRLKTFEQYVISKFKQTVEQLTQDLAQSAGEADFEVVSAAKIAAVMEQLKAYLVAEDYESLSYFAESRDVLMHLPEATFQRLEAAIQELDFEEAVAACWAAQNDSDQL
jgi:hypothetical protein